MKRLARVPSRATRLLQVDSVVIPSALSVFSRLNCPDVRRGGAEVPAESLDGSRPVAAVVFTPRAPRGEQGLDFDSVAGGDDAAVTDKCVDGGAEHFELFGSFAPPSSRALIILT